MSYPISYDGHCPYCHSSDILYIVLVKNDENKKEVRQSPTELNLEENSNQSTTCPLSENHRKEQSEDGKAATTLSDDKSQQQDKNETDKDIENNDTAALKEEIETDTPKLDSSTNNDHLPDIIESLLKLGLAYKVPEDRDSNEIPSFQCRSCGYGFNLDWSKNSLQSIFKANLDSAEKGLSAQSSDQSDTAQSGQVDATNFDYNTYYQYYQYIHQYGAQPSTVNSVQSDTANVKDAVEKTNENVDGDTANPAHANQKLPDAADNTTANINALSSYADYYAYWQNYYSMMNQNTAQQQSSANAKTTVSESQSQSKSKSSYTTEYKDYSVSAFFNSSTGRFQKMSDDQHWTSKGLPSDRDFRQMAHYFDPNTLNEISVNEKQKIKKKRKLPQDQVQKLKEEKKLKKHRSLMKSLLS
ncbi:uncharacterized protein TRIADDRAFT_52640 [Trichoplax adhaerens]|uniref:Uncharacterized protein n=1 Tax=Trichoplax adhaerens TaxID=10228 RepID=B3RJI7_TRIAD|nr:predicted protein [Trichoplax adhaerens]EDV29826.1 predicted protein [Trichoplax adhaerens]|eukprot:XP_002109028.1 predicted protein [Trichoplax adhaerens]